MASDDRSSSFQVSGPDSPLFKVIVIAKYKSMSHAFAKDLTQTDRDTQISEVVVITLFQVIFRLQKRTKSSLL